MNISDAGAFVRVVSGAPSDEEVAAIVAVVSEQYREEAAYATVDDRPARDAWSRSRRLRRAPRGAWGRFSG